MEIRYLLEQGFGYSLLHLLPRRLSCFDDFIFCHKPECRNSLASVTLLFSFFRKFEKELARLTKAGNAGMLLICEKRCVSD